MTRTDSQRWNQRYRQTDYAGNLAARPFLVENAALLPTQGLALDAAMGLGSSAGFLLQRGLRVIGADIAAVAVRQAKKRLPGLQAVLIDLDTFYLPANCLDVIVNFYFLDRALWPIYRQALRPGGVLVFETLTQDQRQDAPHLDPISLLQSGELRQAFADYQELVYREGWIASDHGGRKAIASLITRKPS